MPFLKFFAVAKDMFKKKWPSMTLQKLKKLQIFVSFENEASYEDFFARKCFKSFMDTLCNIFSQNLI